MDHLLAYAALGILTGFMIALLWLLGKIMGLLTDIRDTIRGQQPPAQ